MDWTEDPEGTIFWSLNDDGESNVLEGIQNLELLTDLRETP